MKSLPEFKNWLLAISSIFVLFSVVHGGAPIPHTENQAASFSSALSLGKNLSKVSKAKVLADRARGLCYKGNGAGAGLTIGYAVPALSCNGGLNFKLGVPIPIPDCDLVPGGCEVPDPTSCLGAICALSDAAIWDPKSHMCGCSGPSAGGVAKKALRTFLPI
ncbi:MAG: hypothetical protein V4674_02015 [Patescibacteria group bacterium]